MQLTGVSKSLTRSGRHNAVYADIGIRDRRVASASRHDCDRSQRVSRARSRVPFARGTGPRLGPGIDTDSPPSRARARVCVKECIEIWPKACLDEIFVSICHALTCVRVDVQAFF